MSDAQTQSQSTQSQSTQSQSTQSQSTQNQSHNNQPPSPPSPPSSPPQQVAPSTVEPSEAHVLVVEDNVPNFVLIARMLAFMGVQRCEWKTSGWQVVQFADTLPRVDLILMDIRLPYEDGYQALQKLRGNPKLKDTVVCAVTAEASDDQMRRAKKAGFNGFLGKPLDPDRFPLQIRRLLNGEEVWEWK
jgi:two-component system cell cycle response regulator DivK